MGKDFSKYFAHRIQHLIPKLVRILNFHDFFNLSDCLLRKKQSKINETENFVLIGQKFVKIRISRFRNWLLDPVSKIENFKSSNPNFSHFFFAGAHWTVWWFEMGECRLEIIPVQICICGNFEKHNNLILPNKVFTFPFFLNLGHNNSRASC